MIYAEEDKVISKSTILFFCSASFIVNSGLADDYAILHKFGASKDDGGKPRAGMVIDDAGNLYGTTFSGGGAGDRCIGGTCGTVFKIATDGVEQILYRFTGGADGGNPSGELIRDKRGNLYGTTQAGGLDTNCGGGCGVVFKISATGAFNVLYTFKGDVDGAWPAGLLLGSGGVIYGGTEWGGGNGCHGYGCGTIFRLEPGKDATILHAFTDGEDGGFPLPGLVMDEEGNLYGSAGGGAGTCNCGIVFKLAPDGAKTLVYRFEGGKDGSAPSGLIRDKAGNLFGTTQNGGKGDGGTGVCGNYGCGTIFEIDANGKKIVRYDFQGESDGRFPLAGLTIDNHHNLYGTTVDGGPGTFGTAFKLSPSNDLTVLHAFGSIKKDGISPSSRLLQRGNYAFGTTQYNSGHCNSGECGIAFKVRK